METLDRPALSTRLINFIRVSESRRGCSKMGVWILACSRIFTLEVRCCVHLMNANVNFENILKCYIFFIHNKIQTFIQLTPLTKYLAILGFYCSTIQNV